MEIAVTAPVGFLGIDFEHLQPDELVSWVQREASAERFVYLVTPNVDHVVMLQDRGQERWRALYRKAIADADLRVNDSRILQRLAALSGKSLAVTPGSDLVRDLVAARSDLTGTITLIGGQSSEAEWLRQALPRHAVHHFDPPMGVRDDDAAQDAIAAFVEGSRADLHLFAIGAPQSEIVCHRVARQGRARGVALCIGASVEFLSGTKSRAPVWMQRAGLEWLYRLLSEPGRLWRRYLLRGPRIFALWWRNERGQKNR